jgi:predicted extracellular nuclease
MASSTWSASLTPLKTDGDTGPHTPRPEEDLMKARKRILVTFLLGMTLLPSLIPFERSARAVSTTLVINEIDYDQPGTDASEFLELKNIGEAAINLDTFAVELANGSLGGAIYQTMDLPNVDLAAGDYFVICANAANTANCDLDVTPDTNLIQNGAPDGVGLREGGLFVDAVSYEGDTSAPYTEGTGAGLVDDAVLPAQSISRCGDGSDTDQNNVDFSLRDSTPGTANACATDLAPTITGTSPAGGATNVSLGANIMITFSEDVTVSGTWFNVSCGVSGVHSASVGGGPQSFSLDPLVDFAFAETCSVTIFAAQVSDQDGAPNTMAANFTFSFATAAQPFGGCGDPATFIHDVQGSGATSPLNGVAGVIVEGIVVGDFQDAGQFGGFHMQEEDAHTDGDAATSEGIFIFSTSFPVSAGDLVRVRGRVTEFSTSGVFLTELASVTDLSICSSGNSVTPAPVSLPVNSLADWEAFEGMLISIAQDLTVTENFTLGRFGEVALSAGGRLLNPTMVSEPGAAAIALQQLNDRSRILLDDGNNQQNIDPTLHPDGGLSASNTLRSGSTLSGLTGVLEQRFGAYRVQPVGPIAFNDDNPRPASPEAVGGRLRVAAMNVLNYFTTLDLGPDVCGPAGTLECRGADSSFEFTRQRDKIISAMLGLDADVVGLMEVENDAGAAVQDLVAGLNAASGAGAYAFIDTGAIGTEAIKVGLIYRPATVSPVGSHAILDSTVDPTFLDTLNRPVLAHTFEEISSGERFTVAVSHLKSKGSDCNAVDDPDTGDGQGNCNVTRTQAATALANWLANDPSVSGDPDFLIIGDLNSYAMEDPVRAITSAGYADLIGTHASAPYSFVFQGQSGYLDHALATTALAAQARGATEWHVNADEPIALDYNVEFKSPHHVDALYDPGPYRSSDHDPLFVGLDLDQTPPTLEVGVSRNVLSPPNHKYVTVTATVDVSDNVDPHPTVTLVSLTSNEPDNAPGGADGNTTQDIVILNDSTFRLRAERSEAGSGRIYTITYRVTDAHGNALQSSATVTVPLQRGAGS